MSTASSTMHFSYREADPRPDLAPCRGVPSSDDYDTDSSSGKNAGGE